MTSKHKFQKTPQELRIKQEAVKRKMVIMNCLRNGIESPKEIRRAMEAENLCCPHERLKEKWWIGYYRNELRNEIR